jgi:hypothetical protein
MTSDDTAITAASWRDLEARPASYGSLNARRLAHVAGAALAVDEQARRHVLLPINRLEDGINDTRSRGLVVLSRMLEVEDEPSRPFLDLCCTDPAGRDAFNMIATELLDRLNHGAAATEAVASSLAKWRRFWSTAPLEGLTPEEIRGLFGELWFLLVWLMPHGHEQVRNWVGPQGARSDFQWQGLSIEAKATNSGRGHIHRINGIDQLDPPDHGHLFMYSLRVREEPASSNSLVNVATAISRELSESPVLLGVFEDQLAAGGYSPLHADAYREIRFRIVDERLYRVADDFPRLSVTSFAEGLPDGVERIEYEVNLEASRHLIVANAPAEFTPPPGVTRA